MSWLLEMVDADVVNVVVLDRISVKFAVEVLVVLVALIGKRLWFDG